MTTVTGTVLRPTGEPVVNARIIIDLVASIVDDGAPGYVPADLSEVWSQTVVRTDTDGVWEADLPPTAGSDNVYSQTGVVYSVVYQIGRRDQGIHYINVPADTDPLWVGGLLVDAPTDIPSAAGAPSGASYLVGTTAGLPNEIVVGLTPGGQLGGTWAAPTVDTLHAGGSHVASSISFTPAGTIAATNVQAALEEVAAEAGGGSSAPATADYLVATAQGGLSAEIVVGTSPGGELGGSWSSPTVDTTHSGSSHAGIQSAAEATAAAALSGHMAASDPHPTYLTAAEGNAAYDAIGAAAAEATLARNADNLTSGTVADARIASTIARDSEVTAAVAAEAALARNADNLSSGTVADARIASTIARDSETTAAIAALSSVYQPLDATLTSVAAYNTNGLLAQTAADTFAGRTITGTSNRLAVTNGSGVSGNPTLDIDTGYLGQTSITTLGTIGTGVWNGTTVAVANGGTATTTGFSLKDNIAGTTGDRMRVWDDFRNVTASTTDGTVYGETGQVAVALSGTASGTGAQQFGTDFIGGHAVSGVGQITSGSTTTGKAALQPNNSLTWLYVTADAGKFFARIRIPTLSDGTNTFVVRAGFMSQVTATPTDGGFWFEANAGANWRARVMDDSASTPDSDTGIVVATTYVNLAIVYDNGTCHFYASAGTANMTEVVTAITTGFPDSPTTIIPAVSIVKSAGGTARTVNVDAIGWDYPLARGMTQRI